MLSFLAVKINFLVIKLTRTDNVILLQMPVSNSISDTGESRPADSPAKQKTMRNAIQIILLKRTHKISFQPTKNSHASVDVQFISIVSESLKDRGLFKSAETTQPSPQVFSVNGSLTRNFAALLTSSVQYRKILPNLVDSSWCVFF